MGPCTSLRKAGTLQDWKVPWKDETEKLRELRSRCSKERGLLSNMVKTELKRKKKCN